MTARIPATPEGRIARVDLAVTGAWLLAGAWLAASPLLVGYLRLPVAGWHGQATWNGSFAAAVVLSAAAVRAVAARRLGRPDQARKDVTASP